MARPLQHSTEFAYPVEKVLAAIADEESVRGRLAAIGGHNAKLVDYQRSPDAVRYTVQQGIPAEKLPPVVRKIHAGDLIVKRTQEWRTRSDGTVVGTGSAHVSGVPGSIQVNTALTSHGSGSKLQVTGQVQVSIPLVGGKIEQTIAEQVVRLLRHEDAHVAQQLAHAETG
jgi:hypothetical protein